MNIVILEDEELESSEDCKEALNKYVAKKNWKRLYRYGSYGTDDPAIRCFVNEDSEKVTVAQGIEDEDGDLQAQAFIGIDIQEEIKAIRKIAKYYYTHDYGELFYNPYNQLLWVVGGDGGYIHSERKLTEDEIEEIGYDEEVKEFNSYPETSFIKGVEWADESFPDEKGYMFVGRINLSN